MRNPAEVRSYGLSTEAVSRYCDPLSFQAVNEAECMRDRDPGAPIGIYVPDDADLTEVGKAISYLNGMPLDISLHLPGRMIDRDVVDSISKVSGNVIDIAAFHPETVVDWGIFDGAPFTACVENACLDGVSRILDEYGDIGFVMNLSNAYLVDPSMRYARKLIRLYGDRIRKVVVRGVKSGAYATFREMGEREGGKLLRPLARVSPDVPIVIASPADSLPELLNDLQTVSELVPDFIGK